MPGGWGGTSLQLLDPPPLGVALVMLRSSHGVRCRHMRSVLARSAAGKLPRHVPSRREQAQYGHLDLNAIPFTRNTASASTMGTRRLRNGCPYATLRVLYSWCRGHLITTPHPLCSLFMQPHGSQCAQRNIPTQPTNAPIQPIGGDAIRLIIMHPPPPNPATSSHITRFHVFFGE